MAVATSTAIAIGSIAASTGGAAMSFSQANKQSKLQKQAQADAQKAMDEARKKLEVNYMAGLSIQKEPYELEREALLSQGAQAIQAGVESERGSAATAGRIQEQMNLAQAGQRTAMGKELTDLERATADEQSRLRDMGANLDLEEAAGQQQMARDAAEAKNKAIQQGMASATSALQQGISTFLPLYGSNSNTNQKLADKVMADANKSIAAAKPNIGMVAGANRPMLLQSNLNTPVPQQPLIYPQQQIQSNPFMLQNQPAYSVPNPFNIFG